MNMITNVRLIEPCMGLVLVVVSFFPPGSKVMADSGARSVGRWDRVVA